MNLTEEQRVRIRRLLGSNARRFTDLVAAAGLNPASDFEESDLRGIDFDDDDLAGFSFERADLRGANLARARGLDASMLAGAIADGTTRGFIMRDGPDYPEMVLIPPGGFEMGVPEAESRREQVSGDDDARPEHWVTLSRPFWLGRFPVTRGEYAVFVADSGYAKDGGAWRGRVGFQQTDRHPVVNVSWDDAAAYASWLGGKTGHMYRLPSEAEWEYAARAGTRTARFWGDAWSGHEPFAHRDGAGTAAVDGRRPNAFGLHDMLGNVWEWCADPWHDDYRGAPSDGSIWITDRNERRRVLRGGSWIGDPVYIRAGHRNHYDDDRGNDVGFRLARTSF